MSRIAKFFAAFAASVALLFSGVLPASAAMPSQVFEDPIDSAGISDIVEVQVDGYDNRPGRVFVYLTFDAIVYDWHFEEDVWAAVAFDVDGDQVDEYYVSSGYETVTSTGVELPIRRSSDFTPTGCTAIFFGFPESQEDYVGWSIDNDCLDLPDTFGVQGYVSDARDDTVDLAPDSGFYEFENPVVEALPALSITTRPRITGTAQPGWVISANNGAWNSGVVFDYQWYLDGVAIPFETNSWHIVLSSEVGSRITVEVTGSKSGFASTTLTSLGVTVAPMPKVKGVTPTISGATKLGSTLTAKPGSWTSGTSFTYQWKRNGASIAGAKKSTYKTVAADKGKKITVTVTGKKFLYVTTVMTSAAKLITK